MTKATIKIAIADDHVLITEGLQNMLRYSSDMEVIGTYPNGETLLEGIQQYRPDILLLDIIMPGQRGDELARTIVRQYPAIKIIALTNLDNIYYIKSMLQVGVSGYMLKDIGREEMFDAIRQVYHGGSFLDKVVKERLDEEKGIIKKQTAQRTLLSRREKEVLQMIADNYTSREIAEKLHLSKRTIDRHRESIQSKMEVKSVTALVRKAIELGLVVT